MSMRLRFAPSPTGFLHVGGARTALFNWLLARGNDGTLVLRVEDTDRARSTDEATEAILSGLAWLGIDFDEGPFFQSRGLERHRADALTLLNSGLAYRDFSTAEEIANDREALKRGERRPYRARAEARAPGDEARWVEQGLPFAVRFRIPDGETVWEDLIHGESRFQNADLEDLVILRADGSPTYNHAVVSDDIEMRITHVLRGDDHLSNTPKQILIYEALGRTVPRFAHVPLILGTDGRRLSKRHGATAVGEYENAGILPEAMMNFLALLGWNPGDDREVMDAAELTGRFSLDRVLKKSAVFDPDKLAWLNGQYLAKRPPESLLRLVREEAERRGEEDVVQACGEDDLHALVDLMKVRARTVGELFDRMRPLLSSDVEYEVKPLRKHWKNPDEVAERLGVLLSRFDSVEWTKEALEETLRSVAGEYDVSAAKLIHPLRLALTGQGASAGIFDLLLWLGREQTELRVARATKSVPSLLAAM